MRDGKRKEARDERTNQRVSVTIYASFSSGFHMYIYFTIFFCFHSFVHSVPVLCRSFSMRVRFICTFCYLMCFDISHTHTWHLRWVLFSFWHLHLAFIYSDTLNHKRITSHTYARGSKTSEQTKRPSERANERVSKRTNQQNQAIPFIATDE